MKRTTKIVGVAGIGIAILMVVAALAKLDAASEDGKECDDYSYGYGY